jgi:hypothetical protein
MFAIDAVQLLLISTRDGSYISSICIYIYIYSVRYIV